MDAKKRLRNATPTTLASEAIRCDESFEKEHMVESKAAQNAEEVPIRAPLEGTTTDH
jgi:hypothetical protein